MRRVGIGTQLEITERMIRSGVADVRAITRRLGVLPRTTYRYLKILEERGVEIPRKLPEVTRRRMSGGRGAQPRTPRIKEPPTCVCGRPESDHPTATCREYFERGL